MATSLSLSTLHSKRSEEQEEIQEEGLAPGKMVQHPSRAEGHDAVFQLCTASIQS